MRRIIVAAAGSLFLLLLGAALAQQGQKFYPIDNRPAGGYPEGLLSYQVETLRARRVEVMDEEWRIRMVLTVHNDVPAVTFYNADGTVAKVAVTGEGGAVVGE